MRTDDIGMAHEDRLRTGPAAGVFDDAELDGLPGPVRRYFRAAIAPGAPLARSAELTMRGRLNLNGRWLPLRAHETLTPLAGMVWRARVAGVISGSDRLVGGEGGMDWKLLGLVHVARASGPDVARSAAGRAAGEAVWLPTALLPRFGVRWSATGDRDLTAELAVGTTPVTLHLRLLDDGRVDRVRLDRWGDPDGSGTWDLHPFGFQATGWRTFGPLTVPAEGAAGWFPGTDRGADGEFFRCTVTSLAPVTTPGTAPHTAPDTTPSPET